MRPLAFAGVGGAWHWPRPPAAFTLQRQKEKYSLATPRRKKSIHWVSCDASAARACPVRHPAQPPGGLIQDMKVSAEQGSDPLPYRLCALYSLRDDLCNPIHCAKPTHSG